MSARHVAGGVLVGSPFAGIFGWAVWAAWGTPAAWSILGSLAVAGVIWLGVWLLTSDRSVKTDGDT